MITGNITDVGDQEGQGVTLETIFGTSWHTVVFGSDSISQLAQMVNLLGIAFEKKGAGGHFVWVVALNVDNVETLDLINK